MIDKDFLYLEDTRNHDDDPYGDRLVLTLDPIPSLAADASLSIRATLKLDGKRMLVVQFPDDPEHSHEHFGTAIAAAVVIEDVEQGLDNLRSFAVRQQTAEAIGGFMEHGLSPGSYALCLVARTPHPDPSRSRISHMVRVAKTVFSISGAPPQDGIDAVWLLEYVEPRQGPRSFKANLRHFTPQGQVSMAQGVFLHVAQRLQADDPFPFEKRAVSIAPDGDDSLYFLQAQDDGKSRQFGVDSSDGELGGPAPFDFDTHIFAHSSSYESWVWDGRKIGHYTTGVLDKAFDAYRSVVVLAGVKDSTCWTICRDSALAGGPIFLRRIDASGRQIAETRVVSWADVPTGAILRVLADGGVLAYGEYRGGPPHVVRVGPQGNVVAVSEPFRSNVLDIAVNPFTGEALVVHAQQQGRFVEIVRLTPALSIRGTLKPSDEVFGKAFESFHSAEISAPPVGQRIWISGQRKEKLPSGRWVDREAVGYLDTNGDFTFVQGGMQPRSLLRALW